MGIFSGLTAHGLQGAIGRVALNGRIRAGKNGSAAGEAATAPAVPPGPGEGVLDHLRAAIDPQRIAMIQATLAGDYGAVSRMTEPLRRRRLASRQGLASQALDRGFAMSIGDDGIVDGAVGGPVIDHDTGSGAYADPAWAPGTKLPIESAALATLGQGDPMTRQMMTVEPSQQGPGVVDTAVQQALRAAEEVRVREALTTKGINGYGFVPTKDDYNLLARAIFAEGRGTPKDMEALAYAIVNRVRPRNSLRQGRELSPTLRGVLSAPPQFSFWPNARQPQGSESWVLSAHPERMNAIDRASWEAAVQAAERALSGLKPDPTGHSSFFFASRDYDGNPRNSAAAPGDFYKRGIANGSLIPSPYRSPYPPGGYPWAHYFFEYEGDRGPPKR